MDGNDLGMIARVFMFLLKGFQQLQRRYTGCWKGTGDKLQHRGKAYYQTRRICLFERCCVRVPEWL